MVNEFTLTLFTPKKIPGVSKKEKEKSSKFGRHYTDDPFIFYPAWSCRKLLELSCACNEKPYLYSWRSCAQQSGVFAAIHSLPLSCQALYTPVRASCAHLAFPQVLCLTCACKRLSLQTRECHPEQRCLRVLKASSGSSSIPIMASSFNIYSYIDQLVSISPFPPQEIWLPNPNPSPTPNPKPSYTRGVIIWQGVRIGHNTR